MSKYEHKFYAPTKWEGRLWRLLDGYTDSVRLSLEKLDMDASNAIANCKSALKRMHRSYNVRVEANELVVSR